MNNFVVKNGHVVDPARNISAVADIYVKNGLISSAELFGNTRPDEVIDATGRYVFPGLLDSHAHVAKWTTMIGVHSECACLPNGVTGCIDMGSCGSASFEGFARYTIATSPVTIKGFVHVASEGEVSIVNHPNQDPKVLDYDAIAYLAHYHKDALIGIKIMISRDYCGPLGLAPLEKGIEFAEKLGLPVCVHVTDPPAEYADVVNLLRKGDILCHCFCPLGNTILDGNGKIHKAVWEARDRGVLFDAAYGRMNYSFDVIKKAFADGFYPDLVGADMIIPASYSVKLFGLPYVLSSLYALGMPMDKIVMAATRTTARIMGLADRIGSLAVGADADISVFAIDENPDGYRFKDLHGNDVHAHALWIPRLTVKAGRVLYRDLSSTF